MVYNTENNYNCTTRYFPTRLEDSGFSVQLVSGEFADVWVADYDLRRGLQHVTALSRDPREEWIRHKQRVCKGLELHQLSVSLATLAYVIHSVDTMSSLLSVISSVFGNSRPILFVCAQQFHPLFMGPDYIGPAVDHFQEITAQYPQVIDVLSKFMLVERFFSCGCELVLVHFFSVTHISPFFGNFFNQKPLEVPI